MENQNILKDKVLALASEMVKISLTYALSYTEKKKEQDKLYKAFEKWHSNNYKK